MSPIVFILLLLGIAALVLWLVERYIWVQPSTARTIVFAVFVVLVLLWIVLTLFGVTTVPIKHIDF
jgi:hypothetical protein